ncbi:MAG: hypothetical protein KatS3mg077_2698 [Candidatus Binatia bacterium]|nr:MAG: hypothetical protein KatS3mg077_2698 [Candidatus Binatia bacterium]
MKERILSANSGWLVLAIVVAVLSLGVAAVAQDDDFGRTGFYVAAMGSYSVENFDTDATGVDVKNALGFDLRTGYRLHPNVAVEGSFQHYRERELQPPGGPSVELLSWGFWLNFKFYPITGKVQPYALIGPGFMHLDAGRSRLLRISRDDNGFSPRGGVGLDVYLTKSIAATVEASYVFTTVDIEDKDHIPVTWGFTYRF